MEPISASGACMAKPHLNVDFHIVSGAASLRRSTSRLLSDIHIYCSFGEQRSSDRRKLPIRPCRRWNKAWQQLPNPPGAPLRLDIGYAALPTGDLWGPPPQVPAGSGGSEAATSPRGRQCITCGQHLGNIARGHGNPPRSFAIIMGHELVSGACVIRVPLRHGLHRPR